MHDVSCNRASIPALGFRTWELRGDTARELVEAALEIGYRHVDTAQMYGNEAEVGAAIAASGVPRGDLERSVEESVARLGLEPDLVLLHWPSPDVPLAETVAALNRAAERGLTRHVGVSNFTVAMVEEAVRLSPRPIVTDQVEYHPFLGQAPVLACCRSHGMALTAYCPLARGRVLGEPVLARIGQAHGKGPGQVALRWLVQQEGVVALPRSSSVRHARTNFGIFDFELSGAEMAEVAALAEPCGRLVDGRFAPAWDAA